MKLLFGTGNLGKLEYMREVVEGLGLEIIGLNDLDLNLQLTVTEDGKDPLENAKIKALAYYQEFGIPVFSCDSGLYINGLDAQIQPGVHVRRVNGKELTDEAMIEYYSGLAAEFGGEVVARYKNAICLVLDEEHIFGYDGDDIVSTPFLLTSRVHPKKTAGFPLDSISVHIETGKYYMDLKSDNTNYSSQSKGFRDFFLRTVCQQL